MPTTIKNIITPMHKNVYTITRGDMLIDAITIFQIARSDETRSTKTARGKKISPKIIINKPYSFGMP